jgi:hypothetical protein
MLAQAAQNNPAVHEAVTPPPPVGPTYIVRY